MRIYNEALRVEYDEAAARFSVFCNGKGRAFAVDGRLGGEGGTARVISIADKTFGEGQAIEIVAPNGNRDWIMLFPGVPFVLFQARLKNNGQEPARVDRLRSVSVALDLGKEAARFRAFGTAGLTAPDQNPGSYAYLAVADLETRIGAVAGWITHDRGSGVVFSRVVGGQLWLDAQIDYGRLLIAPGASEWTEMFALGWFDDARLGLEAWADAIARVYSIQLPPQPAGYCTWYSRPYGGASDEEHLAQLIDFAAQHLAPFGFQAVQIDDKWQEGERRNGPAKNFTAHKPGGPYPHGMKAPADRIRARGLTPGIWFMPFAGDHLDPFFAAHPEWFVKRENGEPYEARWGGTSLDMTHPGAREHLRSLAHRMAHEWGYRYFKMDGLWTGTATPLMYVNDGYRDDGIGDAVFHDPAKTNIEAYRDGLKLVRETAGRSVFLLGCCAPQNMRSFGGAFGLVDAMRIGPDNGTSWGSLMRGPIHGSRKYFLHGRVWYNDPDPVYVRGSVPLEHARLICSWVAISGQLNLSSEWYPELPAERLDLLKRTMPAHGLLPRPVDLFENEPPRVWLLSDKRRSPRRDVIALYNWESRRLDFDCELERIGLEGETAYVGFDYWAGAFVPPFKRRLVMSLPAQSCRVLAVRPVADHPQVIGSSRHVTQGMVDIIEERWDPKAMALAGRSKVVGGDPYELRVVAVSDGARWTAEAAQVSEEDADAGVAVSLREANGLARVRIESPSSREISWSIQFRPAPAPLAPPAPVMALTAEAKTFGPITVSWSGADGAVYEVAREGRGAILTHTTHWIDEETQPSHSYRYSVVAMDWPGARSEPRTMEVSTPALPESPPLPPKPQVSLMSLTPVEKVARQNKIGAGKSASGHALRLGGQTYTDGIGLHGPGRLVYERDPAWRRFVAVVGIDEEARPKAQSSMVFKVVSDNGEDVEGQTVLAVSPVLKFGWVEQWRFDVGLPADCRSVRLLVEDAGGGAADSADWVDAGFIA